VSTVECEIQGLTALRDALAGPLGAPFAAAVAALAEAPGRAIVTGVGKSGHVARKIAATLASTGKPAHFLHPAEASHGDLGIVTPQDIVLALSWSGESAELSDIVAYTRRFAVPLIASTAQPESALARAADITLVLPACEEACSESLAPTTSTTMQLALGDALAVALLRRSGVPARSLQDFHPGGRLGARLKRVRDLMHGAEEVPLVALSSTLAEAIVQMTRGRFGMTGVADESGRLVGVVTDGDLRRAFAVSFSDRGVSDVMSRRPHTIGPDELAETALARMNAAAITGLFVLEQERPIGVLHVHDLLRAGVV
jgi:arabinose-5-phosphate isomerase